MVFMSACCLNNKCCDFHNDCIQDCIRFCTVHIVCVCACARMHVCVCVCISQSELTFINFRIPSPCYCYCFRPSSTWRWVHTSPRLHVPVTPSQRGSSMPLWTTLPLGRQYSHHQHSLCQIQVMVVTLVGKDFKKANLVNGQRVLIKSHSV